jgi:hypothetical protein
MVHRWLGRNDDVARLAGHLPTFGCEADAVTGAFDDDLVCGVGEAVQRAVAEDGVTEPVMMPVSLTASFVAFVPVAFGDE